MQNTFYLHQQNLIKSTGMVNNSIFIIFLLFLPSFESFIDWPYEALGQPMRDPRMWGVALDPRASLGRRGAHGAGLVVVFWALSVAAVESLAQQSGITGDWENLLQSEFMVWNARPWASHTCGRSRGITWCLLGKHGNLYYFSLLSNES